MKQHDSKSLSKYLGGTVRISEYETGILSGVTIGKDTQIQVDIPTGSVSISLQRLYEYGPVYPILKPYTRLLEEVEYEGVVKPAIQHVYGDAVRVLKRIDTDFELADINGCVFPVSPDQLETLTALGFGAVENSKSPTGWVGIDGMPCEVEL